MAQIELTYVSKTRGIDEAREHFEKLNMSIRDVDKTADKTQSKLTQLGAKVGSVIAIVYGAQQGASFLNSLYEELGQIEDAADRLGIGIERFQELRQVFKEGGVDANQFTMALDKMANKIGEAAGGSKQAQGQLQALGISLKDIQRLSADQQFLLIGQKIAQLSTVQEQAAAMSDFFGMKSQNLLNTFKQGIPTIEASIERFRKMGLIFDEAVVRKGAAAQDKLDALWDLMKNKLAGALVALVPLFEAIGEGIVMIGKAVDWAIPQLDALSGGLFNVAKGQQIVAKGWIAVQSQTLGSSMETKQKQINALADGWQRVAQELNKLENTPLVNAYQSKMLDNEIATKRREKDNLQQQLDKLQNSLEQDRRNQKILLDAYDEAGKPPPKTEIPQRPPPDTNLKYNPADIQNAQGEADKAQKTLAQFREQVMKFSEDTRMAQAQAANDEIVQLRLTTEAKIAEKTREVEVMLAKLEEEKINEQAYAEDKKILYADLEAYITALKQQEANKQVEIEKRKLEEMKRENYGAIDFMMEDWGNFSKNAGAAFATFTGKLVDNLAEISMGGKATWKDIADDFIRELIRMELRLAVSSVFNWFKGSVMGLKPGQSIFTGLSTIFSEKGNAFMGGSVIPFANGGLIDRTAIFPLKGNKIGVAGESGTEMAAPIHRMRDGNLGIKLGNSSGSRSGMTNNITINVSNSSNPNETARQVQLAVERSMRSIAIDEVMEQRRVGNVLNPVYSVGV